MLHGSEVWNIDKVLFAEGIRRSDFTVMEGPFTAMASAIVEQSDLIRVWAKHPSKEIAYKVDGSAIKIRFFNKKTMFYGANVGRLKLDVEIFEHEEVALRPALHQLIKMWMAVEKTKKEIKQDFHFSRNPTIIHETKEKPSLDGMSDLEVLQALAIRNKAETKEIGRRIHEMDVSEWKVA